MTSDQPLLHAHVQALTSLVISSPRQLHGLRAHHSLRRAREGAQRLSNCSAPSEYQAATGGVPEPLPCRVAAQTWLGRATVQMLAPERVHVEGRNGLDQAPDSQLEPRVQRGGPSGTPEGSVPLGTPRRGAWAAVGSFWTTE